MALPSRIPRRLGGSATAAPASTAASNVYTDTGVNYDVAIGGLPFRLGTSTSQPDVRRTAQYRKQQVDQSQEPGEQTIVQWWVKSQSTFHLGAGQKFMDTPAPGNEGVRSLRYQASTGVNPWNIGQLSLLNQTTLALSSSTATMVTADADGTSTQFLVAAGSTLTRVTETVSGGAPTYTTASVTWGGSGTILALTTDGTYYYVCNSTSLYRGKLTGGSPGAGTAQYTMPSGTSSVVLGWVKSRLIALVSIGGGSPAAKVYTLQSLPASPPAAFPAENYSHPNTDFKWTCITQGPSAIYVGGYSGNHSEIMRFTLDISGAMPTLSGAATAVSFPPSELVLGMTGYVSTALGVATTRGFRVGTFVAGSAGDVQMGPLSVTNATLSGGTVGSDRFFYTAGTHDDGTAGLFRVDTSQPIHIKQFSYVPDQIFGWSSDLRAADNSEVAVAGQASVVRATVDGRIAFLVPGFGLYVQHPSKLVPTGTLGTSRIRFQTLDPKVFRFVRLRGDAVAGVTDSGTISVATSLTDSGGQNVGSLQVANLSDTGDLAANQPATVALTLQLTLTRSGSDVKVGPTLTSYQLKALPAQRRQREIVLPLALYDSVLDNSGANVGGDGTALSRMLALEAMEQASDIVTLQYLGAYMDQDLSEFVVIDSIEYTETSDPTQRQSWGGIAVVTLRTIA